MDSPTVRLAPTSLDGDRSEQTSKILRAPFLILFSIPGFENLRLVNAKIALNNKTNAIDATLVKKTKLY